MSAFTVAYLARLGAWGAALVALQGLLVLASWLAWERAAARAAAAARHRLAAVHFAALALLPLLTLALLQWTVAGLGPATPREAPAGAIAAVLAGDRAVLGATLAGLWLAGVAAMLARLALDVRRVARLRRAPAPAARVAEVRRLARGGLSAAVPRVQLAPVPVPQVVGLWRPVLLAPPGLAALPAAEREAVLLHELAHVRRHDFGWNLLQRVALALLWFQPAAWALHARLARERELCCDALAVRHGASATALARALVRLAESRARPGLAMAIARRGELSARVHRLLGADAAAAPTGRARAAALAASALCLAALGAGKLGAGDAAMGELYKASDFGPTISIQAHDASGSFALRVRQGRVVEASVEAQPIPPGRILQDGDRVTLVGPAREALVVLTVLPQGTIHWKARS